MGYDETATGIIRQIEEHLPHDLIGGLLCGGILKALELLVEEDNLPTSLDATKMLAAALESQVKHLRGNSDEITHHLERLLDWVSCRKKVKKQ